MRIKTSYLFLALIALFTGFLYPVCAFAANTFTVTLPANTEVTMQNPNSVLPFTVTNTGNGNSITELKFKGVTANYLISSGTVPPPGWCVKDVGTDEIEFALIQPSGTCANAATSSAIAPSSSLVFNILVTPVAAAADVTGDTLNEVKSGGFSFSGALPTWTRRSLDISMTASPDSVGTGGEITLVMQVTNRSTAAQTLIASVPEPPTPSNAQVAKTAGPFYGSTLLSGAITSSETSITVDSTAELSAAGGTIQIDSEEIYYSGFTGLSLNGVIRAYNGTTAAAHVNNAAVYSRTQYSLASGATRVIIWKYTVGPAASGTVYFTARATNGATTAKSVVANSNTVVIGNFTASITVDPSSVITGQSVTAQMTVKNNGASALINIAPSVLTGCTGGAVETLLSGPSPSGIPSLASGASGVFIWTYQITGSVGQPYCLSGLATADGGNSTATAASNTGNVSYYSATVAPSVIASASVNKTFTWTVFNGGACTVKEIKITTPAAGGNWTCSSVSPPAGWSGSCATKVSFSSGGSGSDIPSNGTKSFSITFSTTETVASDKVISFPVEIKPRGCGGGEYFAGTYVTVTANAITLAHSPAGPVYADGSSSYAMTATLTSGGAPLSGKTITFFTTNGSLGASSAVTDSNGQATVTLIAPNSPTNTTAVVTASYLNADGTDTVSFTGWTKANLQYWGNLSPPSVDCADQNTFSIDVKNLSASIPMTLTTSSFFAFNDSASGGSSVYRLYLDSTPSNLAAITPLSTRTLTFGSSTSSGGMGGVAGPSGFIAGAYTPYVNTTAPESGLFLTDGGANDQWRAVTDPVTVTGACGTVNVNVIDWYEMR